MLDTETLANLLGTDGRIVGPKALSVFKATPLMECKATYRALDSEGFEYTVVDLTDWNVVADAEGHVYGVLNTVSDLPPESVAEERTTGVVRRLRSRLQVTRMSYLRALRVVAEGVTQVQLAREIGISQPSVNSALKSAAAVLDVRPGFSGATPYEIAQRFDAGELTREQVVDELGRWDYRPGSPSDGYDWSTYDAGEFAEVERAHTEHLIDDGTYDEILVRYSEQGR